MGSPKETKKVFQALKKESKTFRRFNKVHRQGLSKFF